MKLETTLLQAYVGLVNASVVMRLTRPSEALAGVALATARVHLSSPSRLAAGIALDVLKCSARLASDPEPRTTEGLRDRLLDLERVVRKLASALANGLLASVGSPIEESWLREVVSACESDGLICSCPWEG